MRKPRFSGLSRCWIYYLINSYSGNGYAGWSSERLVSWFCGADATGVDGSAAVPRTGLRPVLLLDAAAPSTPVASSASIVVRNDYGPPKPESPQATRLLRPAVSLKRGWLRILLPWAAHGEARAPWGASPPSPGTPARWRGGWPCGRCGSSSPSGG